MKRFGLDRKKVLLVIALAFLMVAIGSAISTHNAIESGMKTLSQNEQMTPAPSPQGGLLQAFIFGNPTPNNPFAGVAYNPALNATLPPAVTFFVLGYGNSSVQISWTGATNAITQDFDYNTSISYTFGAGDYLVEITISSPAIGVSRTVAYNIQVMNCLTPSVCHDYSASSSSASSSPVISCVSSVDVRSPFCFASVSVMRLISSGFQPTNLRNSPNMLRTFLLSRCF